MCEGGVKAEGCLVRETIAYLEGGLCALQISVQQISN